MKHNHDPVLIKEKFSKDEEKELFTMNQNGRKPRQIINDLTQNEDFKKRNLTKQDVNNVIKKQKYEFINGRSSIEILFDEATKNNWVIKFLAENERIVSYS